METHVAITDHHHHPTMHLEVRLEVVPRGGELCIAWSPSASAECAVNWSEYDMVTRGASLVGTPFVVKGIPISEREWVASPLRAFLEQICQSLGDRCQGTVLIIDERLRHDDEEVRRPLLNWATAGVDVGDGCECCLGSRMLVVCRARGCPADGPITRGQRCQIVLAPSVGVAPDEMKSACVPHAASDCRHFTQQDVDLHRILDAVLCDDQRVGDLLRYAANRWIGVDACLKWVPIRDQVTRGECGLLGMVPHCSRGRVTLAPTTAVNESTIAYLGNPRTQVWITIPLGEAGGKAEWARWPYVESPGPQVFISTDDVLSENECCAMLGAMVKLLWLSGLSIISAASMLQGILLSQTRGALFSRLQFAARNPMRPVFAFSPGTFDARARVILQWWAGKIAGVVKGLRDVSGVRRALIECRDKLFDEPKEISTEKWESILTDLWDQGKLLMFIELFGRNGRTEASVVAEFERKLWDVERAH